MNAPLRSRLDMLGPAAVLIAGTLALAALMAHAFAAFFARLTF